MALLDHIKKIMGNTPKDKSFKWELNPGVVSFYLPKNVFVKISEQSEVVLLQFSTLKILLEQGQAELLPNGFDVANEVVAAFDESSRALLNLPSKWRGEIVADIAGNTREDKFSVKIKVSSPTGKLTNYYEIDGPLICFGDTQKYLLGPSEYKVFSAQSRFKDQGASQESKLRYIYAIQQAHYESELCTYELGHFNKLKITVPDKITVTIDQHSNGSLILTPGMQQDATPEQLNRTLGQLLRPEAKSLRVGNEIVLFNEEKLAAVQEIIRNRIVKPKDVEDFLKYPTKYLDATLVDLDLGFSARVHGVTGYLQAYFGDTDESGVSWFGSSDSTMTPEVFAAADKFIKDPETLASVTEKINDAIKTGATSFEHDHKLYDISDKEATLFSLKTLHERAEEQGYSGDDDKLGVSEEREESIQLVVDVDLNDETLEIKSASIETILEKVLYPGDLDWKNFLRNPFVHQEFAVRWGLGLINQALDTSNEVAGALFADDMGLGKTFSALATTYFYYEQCKHQERTLKPTLIVAPLSLLDNWKVEVGKTFNQSPFSDIVVLQSDAEMNHYREGGIEIVKVSSADMTAEPKYSLKVGKNFGSKRLDMPGRLVITTYQTLRDYQFSMCRIDWGMVVFDEAQNIKNPNALQTRAAKGLKADFKMVTTGTPVENSLKDFWCLMDTACPGLLGSYQEFRETYVAPITQSAGDEIDAKRAEYGRMLRKKVGALMLRRTKEDNLDGLPSKRLYAGLKDTSWKYMAELESTLHGHQLEVYDSLLNQQINDNDAHALSTIQQLRNCSLHPDLVGAGNIDANVTDSLKQSAKLASLLVIIDQIKGRNEKCIIFLVNKKLQCYLSVALGKYYELGLVDVINGDTKAVAKTSQTQTRSSIIEKFEAKQGFNLIIMSPVAAGVGLTVVGANNVIHLERHWNPAKEAQATDRVYRIGQKRDVNVYVPVALHPEFESFDANLHSLLSKKVLLKNAVVTPEEVVPQPAGISTLPLETIITPAIVKRLTWQQFEALAVLLIAKKIGAQRYYLTSNGSDHGADGVAIAGEVMHLVQAKHVSGSYNGYSAIQEVYSATKVYEKLFAPSAGTQLYFISNSRRLVKKCRELALDYNVEVIAANDFEELLVQNTIKINDLLLLEKRGRVKA